MSWAGVVPLICYSSIQEAEAGIVESFRSAWAAEGDFVPKQNTEEWNGQLGKERRRGSNILTKMSMKILVLTINCCVLLCFR